MKWQVANCYCRDFPIGFYFFDTALWFSKAWWFQFHPIPMMELCAGYHFMTGVRLESSFFWLDLLPLEILGLGFTLEKHSFGDFFTDEQGTGLYCIHWYYLIWPSISRIINIGYIYLYKWTIFLGFVDVSDILPCGSRLLLRCSDRFRWAGSKDSGHWSCVLANMWTRDRRSLVDRWESKRRHSGRKSFSSWYWKLWNTGIVMGL